MPMSQKILRVYQRECYSHFLFLLLIIFFIFSFYLFPLPYSLPLFHHSGAPSPSPSNNPMIKCCLMTDPPFTQSTVFQQSYTYIHQLSATNHSSVHLCELKSTGEKVAVKIVDLNRIPEYESHLSFHLLHFVL